MLCVWCVLCVVVVLLCDVVLFCVVVCCGVGWGGGREEEAVSRVSMRGEEGRDDRINRL